ncbi:hypothetical protein GCM10010833_09420 [Blastomonas aquatica]|uniref:KfrA N-terminal DNA-binding domain-containing protein n=1 Tax=Blastomonas aquatica TaxID=1510276 RepID=A0ABQ1J007_9SPHN|nr:hypothetical protein GCM10010833_09420 [Blastomonas aquatica]
MRPDLTPEEVYSACDAVMESQRLPRAAVKGHAVWKHLGRGGKGTVEKYTKARREMRDSNPNDGRVTLASVVTSIEHSIGNLLEQSIDCEFSRVQTLQEELAAGTDPVQDQVIGPYQGHTNHFDGLRIEG